MSLSLLRSGRAWALGTLFAVAATSALGQKIPVTFTLTEANSSLQGIGTVKGRYPTDVTTVNELTLAAQTAAGGFNGSTTKYNGTIDSVLGFEVGGSNALNSFQMRSGNLDAIPSGNWNPANWNGSTFAGGTEPADYGFRVLSFVNSALRDVVLNVASVQQTVTPGGTVALNSQFNLNFKSGDLDLDAEDLGTVDQLSLVDDIVQYEQTAGNIIWRNVIGRNEFGNPLYDMSGTQPEFSSGVDTDMFESDPVQIFNANGQAIPQLLVNNPTGATSNLVIAPGGAGRNLTLNLDVNAAASFFLGDFLVKFRFDGNLQGTASIPNDPYPLDGDAINAPIGQPQTVSGADYTVWADNFGQWPRQNVDFVPAITAGADAVGGGQLSSDATFQVVLENLSNMTSTTTSVTVSAASTSTNSSLADLVADVNSALAAAGLTGQVTATADGNRVKMSLSSAAQLNAGQAARALTLIAAPGNTAQTQLGLTNAGPAAFKDYLFRSQNGVLSGDATFQVKVGNGAPVNVTVTQASTAGNTTAGDLAADVNAAFAAAGLTMGNAVVAYDQTARLLGSTFVTTPNIAFTSFTVQVGAGAPIAVNAFTGTTTTLDALVTALNSAMVSAGITNVQARNTDGVIEFRLETANSTDRLTITAAPDDALVTNLHLQAVNVSDARYRMSFNSTGTDGDNELVEITAAAGSVAVNELGIFRIDQKRGGIRSTMLTTTVAATAANGDFNGDGVVSGADYTIWADNFGDTTTGAAAAVPEPAGWSLILLGALAIVGLRKRFC